MEELRTTAVPVIGQQELRKAADILRRYQQGKQNLERRVLADEDWWKLRQWRQFADKGADALVDHPVHSGAERL